MSELPASIYFEQRARAARLLRDNATASCAATVHNQFALHYDERAVRARADEAEGRELLGLSLTGIPQRAPFSDDRWIGAGAYVRLEHLATEAVVSGPGLSRSS